MTLLTGSTWSPRGDTPGGLSVREFLDSVHGGGKPHPELDSTFQSEVQASLKKGKPAEQPVQASLLTQGDAVSRCLTLLPHAFATVRDWTLEL